MNKENYGAEVSEFKCEIINVGVNSTIYNDKPFVTISKENNGNKFKVHIIAYLDKILNKKNKATSTLLETKTKWPVRILSEEPVNIKKENKEISCRRFDLGLHERDKEKIGYYNISFLYEVVNPELSKDAILIWTNDEEIGINPDTTRGTVTTSTDS